MLRKFVVFFTSIVLLVVMVTSCTEDTINVDANFRLEFSSDTVRFDTLFTDMGSATLKLKVYNTSNQKAHIEQIRLMNAEYYHINVSGIQADDLKDFYLNAKDSMLIFVQVKLNPNEATVPMVVRDSILFALNEQKQFVQLEAFGQNAIRLHKHSIESDQVFTDELPYLIDDTLWVKKGATLTLMPGARLYFRKNAVLYVEGRLHSEGIAQNWVELRGDRSDFMNTIPPLSYDLCSGQWGGVVLAKGSFNHLIAYTDVRNGNFGIRIDSTTTQQTALTIKNAQVRNVLGNLLEATNAKVEISNSLLCNAGGYIACLRGGDYTWKHCTLTNYYQFSWGSRTQAILLFSNQLIDDAGETQVIPFKSLMLNSVVYGNYNNEIQTKFDETDPASYSYVFKNCLLKQRVTEVLNPPYEACIFNGKPLFLFEKWEQERPHVYDFHVESGSAVIGIGNNEYVTPDLVLDLDGNNRLSDGSCDAGCYEYVQ